MWPKRPLQESASPFCNGEPPEKRKAAAFMGFYSPPPKLTSPNEEKEVPCLMLARFNPVPTVIFGTVKIGKDVTRPLEIRNPNSAACEVAFVKVPDAEKGFKHIDDVTVEKNSSKTLHITWAPSSAGTVRQIVKIKATGGLNLQVILLGTADYPVVKGKKKRQTNGTQKKINSYPVAKTPKKMPVKSSHRMSTREHFSSNKRLLSPAEMGADEVFHTCKEEDLSECNVPDTPSRRNTFVVSEPSEELMLGDEKENTFLVTEKKDSVADAMRTSSETEDFRNRLLDMQFTPQESKDRFFDLVSTRNKFLSDDGEPSSRRLTFIQEESESKLNDTRIVEEVKSESPAIPPCDVPGTPLHRQTYLVSQKSDQKMPVRKSPEGESSQTDFLHKIHTEFAFTPIREPQGLGGNLISPFECRSLESDRLTSTTYSQRNICPSFGESTSTIRQDPLDSSPFSAVHTHRQQVDESTKGEETRAKALLLEISPPGRTYVCSSSEQDAESSSRQKNMLKTNMRPQSNVGSSMSSYSIVNKGIRHDLHGTECKRFLGNSLKKYSTLKPPKEPSRPVKLYNPETCLIAHTVDPFAASTTADPFAVTTLFYEGEWMEKQEKEFLKWVNALLTPPEELDSNSMREQVNVTDLWQRCVKDQKVNPAPNREAVMLSTYRAKGRLDVLRQSAIALFQSNEVASVLEKVIVLVDKKLCVIRDDRALQKDVGLKQKVLSLLLCYNSIWLRIGLEVTFGEIVPLQSNSDLMGLSRFIINRLLLDPYTAKEHSHPTVPYLYRPSYDEAQKKFTLKKLLMLVFFLDKAKMQRVIKHDPCLFRKNSQYKSSRELLIAFSRDFIKGGGDLSKQLSFTRYTLLHQQTFLDEFEYAVLHLGVDLRCGVRLVRIAEILVHDWTLSEKLRVPPVSRTQKIHNVEVALKALKEHDFDLSGNICARDIVDGHREKTLSLLWQLLYKFQKPRHEKAAASIQKIWRKHRFYLVALRVLRKMREEKAAEEKRKRENSAAEKIQRLWKTKKCQKMFIRTKMAARTVQRWWKRILATREDRARLKEMKRAKKIEEAAICIQAAFRMWKKRQVYLKLCQVVIGIQRQFLENQKKKLAVIKIQAFFRMRQARKAFLAKKFAAVTLQKHVRGWIQSRRYMELKVEDRRTRVVVKIQAFMRMRRERSKYLVKKRAAICIQKHIRGWIQIRRYLYLKEEEKRNAAAVAIQAFVRMRSERMRFTEKKKAALCIQKHTRGWIQRKNFLRVKSAVICIQVALRKFLQRKRYLEEALVLIRTQEKIHETELQQRIIYLRKKQAAMTVQRCFRGWMARREMYKKTEDVKRVTDQEKRETSAILKMQKCIRRFLETRRAKKNRAAVVIQALWRGYSLRKSLKSNERLSLIRQRAEMAIQQGTHSQRLGNRMAHALDALLKRSTLSQEAICAALRAMATCTRLSSRCCESMVANYVPGVIVQVMVETHRSPIDISVLQYALEVLINLGKYEVTRQAVWTVMWNPKSREMALRHMSNFYEKGVGVLNRYCFLLWLFCQFDEYASAMRQYVQLVEKVKQLQVRCMRKKELADKAAAKAEAQKKSIHTPAAKLVGMYRKTRKAAEGRLSMHVAPEWDLGGRQEHPHDNAVQAISALKMALVS